MQIKYFNEREKIVIKPKEVNLKEYNENEEMLDFLNSCDKVNN